MNDSSSTYAAGRTVSDDRLDTARAPLGMPGTVAGALAAVALPVVAVLALSYPLATAVAAVTSVATAVATVRLLRRRERGRRDATDAGATTDSERDHDSGAAHPHAD